MGRPELAKDERYATHTARGLHQAELDQLIDAWTRTLTVGEVEALCLEHAIPAGKVYRAPEMLTDEHFAAREAIVEVPHPAFGSVKMQNAFPKFSATPSGVRRPAPREVGQDNAEVYGRELGLGSDELERLKANGVI